MASCLVSDNDIAAHSSDSNESASSEEERLRQLFQLCDRDHDGFIDR